MTDASPQPGWIPQPGTILDGRYRLDCMVDQGGMGVIMSAEHLAMRREVAVKLLSPTVAAEAGYRARFRREVDLAAQLEHVNIVRCYDFGETDDGVLYLVMEMLSGRSLAAELKDSGRLPLDRAAKLMVQLADGLTEAHMQDIVHRDLKPGNVYLITDSRGRQTVKLLDFGLARLVSSDDARITKTGKICGTASYLPPEMLLTQENTTAGDVYACGLIMLELVLGRKVFSSWSTTQTFLQQLTLPARIPRRVHETPYGQLIARCLRKHPDERPSNADELYRELSKMAGTLPAIRLEDDELPPALNEDLIDSLLDDFNVGRIKTLEALRLLPEPQPFDAEAPPVDLRDTQRIVLSEVEKFLLEHGHVDEEKPTVRLSPEQAEQLRASRASVPAAVQCQPSKPALVEDVEEVGRPIMAYGFIAAAALAVLIAVFAWPASQPPPDPVSPQPDQAQRPQPAAVTVVAEKESAPEPRPAAPVAADVGVSESNPDAGNAPAVEPAEPQPKPTISRRRKRRAPKPVVAAEVEETSEAAEQPATQPDRADAILDKYLKVGKPK